MSLDFTSLFTGMSERDIGYLLKNMVQKNINEQLTNTDISTIDNKTPVLITISKDVELINDIPIQSAINIETPTVYQMTEEPDGVDLKIWLKFQNAGELIDWSYQKNKSFSTGANTMPGLFSKYNESSMMKYELYSYFNGASHYAYTLDSPQVRILPNIQDEKITSFFMRMIPISIVKVLYAENNSLFTKIDDDQLRYGYSVTMDINGGIHFYVKNNYVQYHLFVKDAYANLLTDPLFAQAPQFRFENFNKNNFLTGYQFLCKLIEQELPFHDWFFKYNPTTHAMTVINTSENNFASIYADTSLVTPVPVLSCPIQEGKWTHSGTVQTTIYDNSGNGNNGTITGITTGGAWQDDNTLLSLGSNSGGTGDGMLVTFPTISALNSATSYTISFWYKPDTTSNTKAYSAWIMDKNYANNSSWIIYRPASGSTAVRVEFKSSTGTFHTATFNNAFPEAGKWYHIVVRFSPSSSIKLFINGVVQTGTVLPADVSVSSGVLRMFRTNTAAGGTIALLKVFTSAISDSEVQDIYYEGYHNPLFPKSENIQPVPEEDPKPILIPFSNIYTLDKMATPTESDYRKINSLSGNNPFIQLHSVADGTSTTDPETLQYDVDVGTTGGGGGPTSFTEIYACTDPDNNSSSQLTGSNTRSVVELQSGSSLIGKRVTKAIFYLKGVSTPTGTVKCKVWNASGTEITELWLNGTVNNRLNAASVNTSTHTAYTFQNTDLTNWGANSLANKWKIGIEYSDGSGSDEIQVKRNRFNPRPNEWNNNYDGSWDDSDNPDDDDLVGNLYEGGTGTPTTNPYFILKSNGLSPYDRATERFGTGDILLGKAPTKCKFTIKKSGSPTGTLRCYLVTAYNGTVKAEFTPSINISSGLTTTPTEYTFTNLSNTEIIQSGYVIMLKWDSVSASGEVHVYNNNNISDSHNGNNSYAQTYGNFAVTNYNSSPSLDLSGKIYTGGNDFDAFLRFSSTITRITTKIVNISSSLNNKKITKVLARIKKSGAPGGILNCYIRDASDNIKVTFSSIDVSTLTTSYEDYEFTNVVHNYYTNNGGTTSGDKISFEYIGANPSNYVELNCNKDVFNGLNTITQTYDGANYTDLAQRDLAGKTFTGGEPDLGSRTRVAQSIEHQNSRLKGKKITRVKTWLYRTTSDTSGTAYCNIRNSSDILIKTLNTISVSTLSTVPGTPTEVQFEDTTNNYPMTVGDKVCIEFNGGSSTDAVGVLVREVTPNYDDVYSMIRKFDEVDYDDVETTKDLCAVMDEGGFEFTPDPNAIPDPTPTNIKDLLYMAGNNAKSGFQESFLMEFRIYTKDISLDQADFLYENRCSISPIAPNQILTPFSLRPVTLDPV